MRGKEERGKTRMAARTVNLPCEIGDTVWMLRKYHKDKTPKEGNVWQMFFSPDMRLIIGIKGVGKGEWGKNVWATREEAEKALKGRQEQ